MLKLKICENLFYGDQRPFSSACLVEMSLPDLREPRIKYD